MLRRDATDAERKVWGALRGTAMGIAFRRQHPIGGYIVDFVCVEARLVVEIDGGQQGGPEDARRDAALRAARWTVLRYWNSDVTGNFDGVLHDIARALSDRGQC